MAAAAQAPADNAKLTELYTTDQSARQGDHVDGAKLYRDDQQRRVEVHRMLAAGDVKTGGDYYHAAMIFQHGENPDDYLLAHVLAMDAVAQGDKDARWLSAATLDRYLRSIWQMQVFGTQYQTLLGEEMKHDPMNAELISDSMRAATCVTSLQDQNKVLDDVHHGKGFGSSQLKDCK